MKLKKIVLQKSHKVMTPVEMKGIIDGQITKSGYCSMSNGSCSGYCAPSFDGHGGVSTKSCTRIHMSGLGGDFCSCT